MFTFFFPAVNWLYRLQMGLFTQLLSFNGLARRLQRFVKNLGNEQVTQKVNKKDLLKKRLFSTYIILAVFISLIKFSKIVFAEWNFVRSLLQKQCLSVVACALKINWIGLFYFILNSGKWENSLSVFREILLNTATITEVNSTEIDSNFTARETGLRVIRAPSYKQRNKLSQLQNTQLNLLTVNFLTILKWTEINLRWLIVDGCVKEGKRLIIYR